MSRRPQSLLQRIRDQLGFSLVAVLVLFVLLRFVGVRSTVASFALSVVATIALNVGLSYYYERRARRGGPSPARRADGDIRWREDHDDARARPGRRDALEDRSDRRRPYEDHRPDERRFEPPARAPRRYERVEDEREERRRG